MSSGQSATAISLGRERLGAIVAAVPLWLWLGGLVALSAAVRYAFVRTDPGPWIFIDELRYSELAKSFASSGSFSAREAPTSLGVGPVYPVLLAPAWALFDDVTKAYAAAKVINCVLMSLTAIPAYFLARRVLGVRLSVLGAVLTVAIPGLLYTGTIMTENAFYPAFVLSLLAIVLALERPTLIRQVAALASILLAYLVRPQGAALAPALVCAIVLAAILAPREGTTTSSILRYLARYAATWALLAVAALAYGWIEVARGGSPFDAFLGGYSWTNNAPYSVTAVSRWFLYHLAELDLALGVLPFAAFGVLVARGFRRRESSPPEHAFVVASTSALVWLTLIVAAFASVSGANRVEERNLFYVMPLFFIALLVWVERGFPRRWQSAGVAAVAAAALPGVLPFSSLINVSAVSDTFALLPIWGLQDRLVAPPHIPSLVAFSALLAGAFFLLVPRRLAIAAPLLVLGYLAASHSPIEHRINRQSSGTLASGIGGERAWIDAAVGRDAPVAALWSGNASVFSLWENEFFNRSVGPVHVLTAPFSGGLPESPVTLSPASGQLLDQRGKPVPVRYALTDRSVSLAGTIVAEDRFAGMTLYRVDGPLAVAQTVGGIYADTWSGPEVTYQRLSCAGGSLSVSIVSDPGLFESPQTVVARSGTGELARITIDPEQAPAELVVPLAAEGGRCDVVFTVTPTAVPAQVLGTADTRELGVHLTGFRYQPPSP